MLTWFGELNAKERRTMGACFGGWALDAFDVQMYSFVIPTVIALWGLSRGEAGLIGTVTLLISSLGGWFSGTLADRFGRVRMLQTGELRRVFLQFTDEISDLLLIPENQQFCIRTVSAKRAAKRLAGGRLNGGAHVVRVPRIVPG